MKRRRFYAPDYLGNESTILGAEESHHLLHVLRLGLGDEIELFDGVGHAAKGIVGEIAAESVTVVIQGSLPAVEPAFVLALGVCPPKGERMDGLVRQVTELGVASIHPLSARYATMETSQMEARCDRWRRIALQACKQSGRCVLPEVASPQSVSSLLAERASSTLVAQPGAPPATSLPVALDDEAGTGATVIVGPEGGFSEDEKALMASVGATLFSLGPRTLRVETASVVAVALIQARYGDLG